jgi:predicted RNA-binding Zn ribbon-like protein
MDLPDDLELPLASGAGWWYWQGGRTAIDFVNTHRERWWRNVETLVTPQDLSLWLQEAHLLDAPAEVTDARLRGAHSLRAAIETGIQAAINHTATPSRSIDEINRWLRHATPPQRLTAPEPGVPVLRTAPPTDPIQNALAQIALDAAVLLGTDDRDRLRVCASDTCSVRFFDASRAATRRWCSMTGCGNTAKARRHRARNVSQWAARNAPTSSRSEVTSGLMREAWVALGGEPDLLELVTVTGDQAGLLSSNLPALPAMLAAVAVSTLAASVLDATRRGRPPAPVLVDAEHVALAACSERFARRQGTGGADLFAPLSRFWRTADGWVRLHANYAWHRERALEVLGCDRSPEAVEQAVLGWRGEELESTLAAGDALGFVVRSPEQWSTHPQGSAVAGLPLLESIAGAGPGRAAGRGRGAVGRRVLDLTRVIAGPVATRTLAAWGAEVLRLDSPHLPEIPAQALDMLSGKRSALLDFGDSSGRAQLEELLAEADVVVQGYRPGALARYGLSAEDLTERHPHLSVISLSAWGTAGPWAARRGFDSLVQCPTGIAAAEGDQRAPGALPAQVLDHATGYLAAAAALLALAGVERGVRPRLVQLSLAQTARWLTSAGPSEREPLRQPQPEPVLVSLPGSAAPVHVISPPGATTELHPAWTSTTDLGADPPTFTPPTQTHVKQRDTTAETSLPLNAVAGAQRRKGV